jgi:hypothetical protein
MYISIEMTCRKTITVIIIMTITRRFRTISRLNNNTYRTEGVTLGIYICKKNSTNDDKTLLLFSACNHDYTQLLNNYVILIFTAIIFKRISCLNALDNVSDAGICSTKCCIRTRLNRIPASFSDIFKGPN